MGVKRKYRNNAVLSGWELLCRRNFPAAENGRVRFPVPDGTAVFGDRDFADRAEIAVCFVQSEANSRLNCHCLRIFEFVDAYLRSGFRRFFKQCVASGGK